MPSDYQKWLMRNEKPAEKIEYTKAEQAKNWWHYNRWYIFGGLAAGVLALNLLLTTLGVGQIRPDLQVACITAAALPDDTAAALQAAFEQVAEDHNGDGRVVVQINRYVTGSGTEPDAAMIASTASTRLMLDLSAGESFFFLTEDPAAFQAGYEALAAPGGGETAEGEAPEAVRLLSLPAFSSYDFGSFTAGLAGAETTGDNRPLLEPLYLSRRVARKDDRYKEQYAALWEKLTAGAE